MKEPECSPECKIVVPNPTLVHGSGCPWMAWKHEQAKLASEPKCLHIFETGSTAGCRKCKAAWSNVCPGLPSPRSSHFFVSHAGRTAPGAQECQCQFCKLTLLPEGSK